MKRSISLLILTIFPFFMFSEEILDQDVLKEKGVEFSFSADNYTKFNIYSSLENETTINFEINKEITEEISVGGYLNNYTYLVEDQSSSFKDSEGNPKEHYNSAYLAENRLNAAFQFAYNPTDWFEFDGSVNLEFNARPDNYEGAYRMGAGGFVGLYFDFADQFLSFGIENSFMPVMGLGEGVADNVLFLNGFLFDLRFDVFNFIRDNINLGLFVTSEMYAENYWGGENKSDGVPIWIQHEFFAGLVYTPAQFFECSFAFAMFNYTENDFVTLATAEEGWTDLGLRIGADFAVDYFSLGIGYRPHLAQLGNPNFEVTHAMDVAFAIEL